MRALGIVAIVLGVVLVLLALVGLMAPEASRTIPLVGVILIVGGFFLYRGTFRKKTR